jgi:hypothetical protein
MELLTSTRHDAAPLQDYVRIQEVGVGQDVEELASGRQ